MRAYDDERLAHVYQHGNLMPEASLRAWITTIAAHAPADPAVVEVGAGTGVFCLGFARYSDARRILGVDPSVPMLREARLYSRHPLISYVAGTAEALPARAAAFDLALLSRVIHHLPDRRLAAEQLARVLGPGGVAVIRTTFRERLDSLVYDYWPELLAADASRFPSESEVVDDFVSSGFEVERTTSVALPVTESLAEYADHLAERPQSKFNALTHEQFLAGLRRLNDDVAAGNGLARQAVAERYDLLALRRRGMTALTYGRWRSPDAPPSGTADS